MVTINIAQDFSETPGGRYIKEGEFSGEQFRKEILKPKYEEAVEKNEHLIINLDGGYGYPSSFLDESFGGLARDLKDKSIIKIMEFISLDEPKLVEDIKVYIEES